MTISLSNQELADFQLNKKAACNALYRDLVCFTIRFLKSIAIFFKKTGKFLNYECQLSGTNIHCVSTALDFLTFLIRSVDK